MGLFSKEACVLCGKEVGVLKRTKLSSKEFVCNECAKHTHEFARLDYCTLDEVRAMIEELGPREEEFDKEAGSATVMYDIGTNRLFYYSTGSRTGEFAFKTPKTGWFDHKYIFRFRDIGPYDRMTYFEGEKPPKPDPNKNYVAAEEKKSGDQVTGYCLCFPYNDKTIQNVKIDLERISKEDAENLAERINNIRHDILLDDEKAERERVELHTKNIYASANAMLKAAVKGEDVNKVVEESAQRLIDIEEGRIKKKSFFDKLRGKKDLDRD